GSFLTGIGFTMALFISSLALEGEILDAAKVGVLGGSLLSAVVGMVLLSMLLPGKAGR
ncbi:MAG: Na+/H+ antiporter NhaA, partial [Proteobacteria bacterium]|nr:Na+/H+ antiporter NhaA [Pseudomonadota bacterium]